MRIAVIGAGVVGVTSAWELARDGHEVTVYERRGSVAGEASFAHGGLLAVDLPSPFAIPGERGRWLRQMLLGRSPFAAGMRVDLKHLRWLSRWWLGSSSTSGVEQRSQLARLAHYSRERLHWLTREERLDYERVSGLLVLLRGEREVASARPVLARLADSGVRFSLVDAARCRQIERGLQEETPLRAGIHLHDGEAGNCREFVQLLRAQAQRRGTRFMFDTDVRLVAPGQRPEIEHVHTPPDAPHRVDSGMVPLNPDDVPTRPLTFDRTRERFDAVVVCTALDAPDLLRPLGLRLPLAGLWGYTLTAPLRHHEGHPDIGPRAALIDARHGVGIVRLGQRVRVSGAWELGGHPAQVGTAAIGLLHQVLADWFPAATRQQTVQQWKGARAALPDGLPLIGPGPAPGVWLNLGHGDAGWALACGSARLLADRIAGRTPAIDPATFDLARLG